MAPQRKPTATTDAATSVCASDAFPSGLYGKYKRATDFFLHWLLRARSSGGVVTRGNGKKQGKPTMTLDVYEQIVTEIARDPTALAPELLQLWRRALAACETAITLRARVALFFTDAAEANGDNPDTHAHFLDRLQSWLAVLQQVTPRVEAKTMKTMKKPEPAVDFANFYTVLELPDDYFNSEYDAIKIKTSLEVETTTTHPMTAARTASTTRSHDRKLLADETGDSEFYVELSFFFMELEELLEAVHNAFLDVKYEKKSLLEATVITKVAVDCAVNVITRLELRHPWIRSCYDVMAILDDVALTPGFKKLWDAVLAGWSMAPDEDQQQTDENQDREQSQHPKYVPGSIVVDFVWVSKIVKAFVTAIPTSNTETMCKSSDAAIVYDEDQTPQQVWPSMDDTDSFFGTQLRLLYDELCGTVDEGSTRKRGIVRAWFMGFFNRVITTRTATLPCVFLVICWAHSVAVLQGNGELRSIIRRSNAHCQDLGQRIRETMNDPPGKVTKKPTPSQVDRYISGLCPDRALLQANPFLAGCEQLDLVFGLHFNGTRWSFSTHRLKTFGQCYNALVQRGLLDAIPAIEDVLQMYEPMIFKPNRRATGSGAFLRNLSNSLECRATRQPPSLKHPRAKAARDTEEYFFDATSRVFRLLSYGEYTVLPTTSTKSGSWKTLLSAVSDVCTDELYGSRVLSRDVCRIVKDITSVFHAVCDEVMKPLFDSGSTAVLPILDGFESSLTPQELMIVSLIYVLDSRIWASERRKVKIKAKVLEEHKAYSSRAADVISRHFARRSPQEADAAYFVFPRSPQHAEDKQSDRLWDPEAVVDDLMEILTQTQGLLPDEDFARLKEDVREDPALLRMMSGEGVAPGRGSGQRLLKRIMQAGAFQRVKPIRLKPADSSKEASAVNMTALHCADAELVDVVRSPLEADFMQDLNAVVAQSDESLVHFAATRGHRELFRYLVTDDADMGDASSRAEAAEQSRQSLVRYCDEKRAALQAGADKGTKTKNNKTTLQASYIADHAAAMAYIQLRLQ